MTHPKLLAAMRDPIFYPEKPDHVEVIQTHISYIFIAGDQVYKVKKAVDFGFLDFTSLEKRKRYCEEELRLNRRLAPDTYLDVVAIWETSKGDLGLGSGDRIVDYAVRMKKLPQERMLKKTIGAADFDPAVLDAIAQKLADFHSRADTGGGIDETGGIETIIRNHEENFAQTEKYIGITIPDDAYRLIKAYVRRFLKDNEPLFRSRVSDHRIRDCHGDLHLEHIVVDDEIAIFDCIEFNERFRYGDVAAEVAFLSMDLDFNGYGDYAKRFVDAYTRYANDEGVPVLLNFYRCYYAYVRGKVVSFRLDDPAILPEDREAAKQMAGRYFDLAYTYACRLDRPTLILMAGLMGTGKSVVARQLAPRLGAEIIQTDVLRKELLGLAPTDRRYEAFGAGIYGADMSRRTYEEAIKRASALLLAGQSAIIDASYKKHGDREDAIQAARKIGADCYLIICTCPEAVVKERLDARMNESGEASDGRWELYLAQKKDFDAITEITAPKLITAVTAESPEVCAGRILEMMKT